MIFEDSLATGPTMTTRKYRNSVKYLAQDTTSELTGELGELEFYFNPCINKIFGGFGFFLFALFAEKFEKWTTMKLPSTFQLATLFVKQRCTLEFLYLLRDSMN